MRLRHLYKQALPCVMLCMVLAAQPAWTQTTVAGATPGQFSVNESGAATYSIPIQVPPGVAGMQPKLSLEYNSQGGNGLLGMGWSLSGLSAITRCPRTMAQDGVRGGVNYDMNDRFCLDGQRLMLVSGTYGVSGSEYRTERESFSRITAYGSTPNGPASFVVKGKAGLTIEYGGTEDSKIEAQGKTSVRVWAASKITDSKGNYLEVAYSEDAANGSYYPLRIDYAGNSVRFEYESRSDMPPAYQAGALTRTILRLKRISTYAGSTPVRNNQLIYSALASGSSRLEQFVACPQDGSCLPAVGLSWPAIGSDGQSDVVPSSYAGGLNFGLDLQLFQTITGDFSGDGKSDFARIGPETMYVFLGRGDGQFDVVISAYGGGLNFGVDLQLWQTITGDFNGDGKSDFARVGPGTIYVFLGRGDGKFDAVASVYPGGVNFGVNLQLWQTITGDFNGDGKSDFARVAPDHMYVFLGRGDGQFDVVSSMYAGGLNFGVDLQLWQTITGDFNGDGKSDFARVGPGTIYIFLSRGDGQFEVVGSVYAGGLNFGVDLQLFQTITGDFNGDGKTDFARVGPGVIYVFLGRGDGQFDVVSYLYPGGLNFGVDLRLFQTITGDFSGDGKTDFARVAPDHMYVFLSRSNGADGNALQRIETAVSTNGTSIGDRIEMAYKSIAGPNAPTLYQRGDGALYPVIDLQYPQYVVSSVSTSNGIGGVNTTQYNYGGLKAEQGTGRGMLGFRWMKSRNLTNNIESYTEFNQNWPFTGTVAKNETRLAGSGNAGLLKRTTNSYSQSAGSAGDSLFVYPSQSVEESWDLSGGAYPSTTTNYMYGQSPQYGDPTQISVSNSEGASKTTANEYWPADSSNWILGRLKKATVTSVKP